MTLSISLTVLPKSPDVMNDSSFLHHIQATSRCGQLHSNTSVTFAHYLGHQWTACHQHLSSGLWKKSPGWSTILSTQLPKWFYEVLQQIMSLPLKCLQWLPSSLGIKSQPFPSAPALFSHSLFLSPWLTHSAPGTLTSPFLGPESSFAGRLCLALRKMPGAFSHIRSPAQLSSLQRADLFLSQLATVCHRYFKQSG